MKDYSDIIALDRPESKHPRMPQRDRAAQFAPFAALSGHGAAVAEAARTTDTRLGMSDADMIDLNQALVDIEEHLSERPSVCVVYFEEDPLKEGGKYIFVEGNVRTIDDFNGHLVMVDGQEIPIADIFSIETQIGRAPTDI